MSLYRRLIVILLIAMVGGAIGIGFFFLGYQVKVAKKYFYNELLITAELIGKGNIDHIRYENINKLQENLRILQLKDSIQYICVYDEYNEFVVSYSNQSIHASCPKETHSLKHDHGFEVRYVIFDEGVLRGMVYIVADNSDIIKHIHGYIYYVIILLLFASLMGIIIYIYVRKFIIAPIVRLSTDVNHISKSPYGYRKLKKLFNDEIGDLVDDINNMVEKIRRFQSLKEKEYETRKINAFLETKVVERTRQLEETAADLKRSLEVRRRLIANLSHEIRTPYHQIGVVSEMLTMRFADFKEHFFPLMEEMAAFMKAHSADAKVFILYDWVQEVRLDVFPKLEKNLQTLSVASKRQSRMCHNIFIMDQLIQDHAGFYLSLRDFKEVIYKAIDDYSDQEGRLQLELPDDPVMVMFDYNRMLVVLDHLFSNAAAYAPEGNLTITVSEASFKNKAGVIKEGIKLVFSDEGVGIPGNELDFIFEIHAESSYTRNRSGGRGMGLTISREIIQKHQGIMWAENNDSKGASFIFIIPRA